MQSICPNKTSLIIVFDASFRNVLFRQVKKKDWLGRVRG
ncbi:hypothetical protein VCRA2119O147_890027 [Vibrio crassostreae]|nr:hypothetical protein VCRA2119O430_100019 [Vibrio crassostreae]CAK1707879.1 hypothetical protein VCRA2113O409_100146 [Vibrio crassostreae]CAK1710624.1 hypothetical protein VCRA2117O428_110019 [Vibrio crassostreae]CAK1711423.1 hypothetical protein VCRA2113O416_110019 [Vibrio crassostreae]CAK1713541.1 hypothetical protein VCRA2113O411_110019 [Vibrio crassostreae]